MNNLYTKNYKTFKKEIKDDSNKKMIQRNQKISHALWLEELILWNSNTTQSSLQIYYESNKIIHDIFHRIGTNNPKMYMEK